MDKKKITENKNKVCEIAVKHDWTFDMYDPNTCMIAFNDFSGRFRIQVYLTKLSFGILAKGGINVWKKKQTIKAIDKAFSNPLYFFADHMSKNRPLYLTQER